MDGENILGKSGSASQVTDFAGFQAAIQELARQASVRLLIFDRFLSGDLFNSVTFIDALRHLLSGSARAEVRILVSDIDRARNNAPQLFQLSRRVPSHMHIRQTERPYHHSFVVADDAGYLDHRMGTGHEAEVHFNHPAQAASLTSFFNEIWNRSEASADALEPGT